MGSLTNMFKPALLLSSPPRPSLEEARPQGERPTLFLHLPASSAECSAEALASPGRRPNQPRSARRTTPGMAPTRMMTTSTTTTMETTPLSRSTCSRSSTSAKPSCTEAIALALATTMALAPATALVPDTALGGLEETCGVQRDY